MAYCMCKQYFFYFSFFNAMFNSHTKFQQWRISLIFIQQDTSHSLSSLQETEENADDHLLNSAQPDDDAVPDRRQCIEQLCSTLWVSVVPTLFLFGALEQSLMIADLC